MRRPGAAHSVAWKHHKREIQLGSSQCTSSPAGCDVRLICEVRWMGPFSSEQRSPTKLTNRMQVQSSDKLSSAMSDHPTTGDDTCTPKRTYSLNRSLDLSTTPLRQNRYHGRATTSPGQEGVARLYTP
ncbi:hypothetical protein T265_12091 [Opisthorchis viverrini]|uniref:Uncharacterized protein n=1 Tax=Opisthorchis viverrini TaxID=6198 RepID=A0A074YW78_OPIVI|nr:hypothetical protein T265_12091 [Opisthorchis viverrini]KER18938.1 hypothetical protein T265_12091 [Opisthorchis viverrini]